VDKVAFPACHDEEVIYEVRVLAEGSDSVAMKADKLVGTTREFMGELHFAPREQNHWQAVFQTTRVHALWDFTVAGDSMTGTLVDVPTGRLIRRISVRRLDRAP
jgi:hypothetical protein